LYDEDFIATQQMQLMLCFLAVSSQNHNHTTHSIDHLLQQADHKALCRQNKPVSSRTDGPGRHREDTVGDGHSPLATDTINDT